MHVKRVAVAGVVVEGWRELEVRNVREIKLCPDLPAEHECIGVRGELSLTAYWLRRCRARANWVCRVRIVINKLTEVCEDVDFHQRFRWRWRGYIFPVLAVGHWLRCSATDGERVFPLFRQTFRIDVVIPHHSSIDERVRHFAAGECKSGEAFVASICLADKDAVIPFCERSATTRRGRRRVEIGRAHV